MKKRYLFLIASTLLVTLLSGCDALSSMMKKAKDQHIKVEPNPMELHGDSVVVTVTATLPAKMLKPSLVYTLQPTYDYSGQSTRLDDIVFDGDSLPNAASGATVTKQLAFAYEGDAMNVGALNVAPFGKHKKSNKEAGPLPKEEVAVGLVTTPALIKASYGSGFVRYDYSDEVVKGWTPDDEFVPTQVDFFFLQGRSELRTSEKRSDRGKFFNAFIAEKNVTKTVTITGTHSPEGAERINSKLSENRAKVIEKYYRAQMKRYDYKSIADEIRFILKPVIEDWSDFKVLLNTYEGIDENMKREINNVINGGGSFEEKEKKLRSIDGYKKIFKDLYPKLRTAKTEILTKVEKRTPSEVVALANQVAKGEAPVDTLSYGELAYAAYLSPSAAEKVAIYEVAIKTYDHWAAHNNLGASYLLLALLSEKSEQIEYLDKAKIQFEISANKKKGAYSTGNIGITALLEGNKDKAYELLSEATEQNISQSAAQEFNSAKGYTEVKQAKYESAVMSYTAAEQTLDNVFNKALSQLLSGDYVNTLSTLHEISKEKSDYAEAYYVSAIASARQEKVDDAIVVMFLEKAIQADPSLKQKALADLEFSSLSGNEDFRKILQ